jgi:dienelactone hydrolase
MNIFPCLNLIILMLHTSFSISNYGQSFYPDVNIDSLPSVFPVNHPDLIACKLKNEAIIKYCENQLPDNLIEWESYRIKLKNEIIRKSGAVINHDLPLNLKETNTITMKGYKIKNITFQTRPGVYATANLYIPEGDGPFPGVINMSGHFRKGKIDQTGQQAVGHSLALNGYVCLSLDPWGAGERATIHGTFEYHGANLGASLINIGESLMGSQISDNFRGVDLLCSLPCVNKEKIGATGASGGGNQTMWFSAVDDRIKAAVPVVSVGTLESYIMRPQCICELLIDGLTFTEEAAVLALSNAVMPCNHLKDVPVFQPSEMLRSLNNAREIFRMKNKIDHISYKIFDLTHGYMAEDREAMLGWFDYHLKGIGTGQPKKEKPFELLPEEKLMVFQPGRRDDNVISTDEYCRRRGNELRDIYLNNKSFDLLLKKNQLKELLRIDKRSGLKEIHHLSPEKGWERFILETSDNRLLPLVIHPAAERLSGYIILCDPGGKRNISLMLVNEYIKQGYGVAVIDLTGTGESESPTDRVNFGGDLLHTISIDELWLGRTIIGEWVEELNLVTEFLTTGYKATKLTIDGKKEAGVAGLLLGALRGSFDNIILRDAPVSYVFDNAGSIDFFSMAIHLPGFLCWGDISLAAALSGGNIEFINPVTMSGQKINEIRLKEYNSEFSEIRKICRQPGITVFY